MTDSAWWQAVLTWGTSHPYMVLGLILITSCLESGFIVGMLVPATPILFALAALTATSNVSPWLVVLAAGIGGILGDQASFWLGRWMRHDLRRFAERSRYGIFIKRGEEFFQRHGGKSVAAGRMLGALRPVMPTVAGAAGMSALSFTIIDSLMQIPWVAVYILPGLFFGASIDLLAEIGGHLLLLLAIVLLPLGLLLWLARRSFNYLSRRAELNTLRLLRWSQKHRRLGLLGPNLADPRLPETPALALLAVLLLALSAAFSLLLEHLHHPGPGTIDAFTYYLFQRLHNPWTDTWALALAQLGNWQVYGPLALAVLVLLGLRRRWLSASHWLAALGFGALLGFGRDALVAMPEPLAYFHKLAAPADTALLSGHLIMSTVVYGFLAVLLATGRSQAKRWTYYGFAITLITLIALARLYLGAQWLSDTLLGAGIGTVWVLLLSLGYRRHLKLPLRVISLTLISLLVVGVSVGWRLHQHLDTERSHYFPPAASVPRALPHWTSQGFAMLPTWRKDLAERHNTPLNLQWRGSLPAIRSQLVKSGWRAPPPLKLATMLQWLRSEANFEQLPVLPQLHGGQRETLLLEYPLDTHSGWVLRLWPAQAQSDGQPLWLGNLARYQVQKVLFALQLPRSHSTPQALKFLQQQFPASLLRQHPQSGLPVLLLMTDRRD